MESTTSFDLIREIQQWRDNLAASPAFRGENLDELESHLRDSVSALQSHGLAPDEAFIIAARRIGKGGSLETEFAKVNRRGLLLDRTLWMLVGIQIWGLSYGVIRSTVSNLITLGWYSWDSEHYRIFTGIPITFIGLDQVLALAPTILLCWWLVSRNGERLAKWLIPLLNHRTTQAAACAWLCLASVGVYSLCQFFRAPFNVSHTTGTQSRTLDEIYILIGPAIQIVTMMIITLVLARKRLRLT
jgi:hypothetical protein